MDSSPSITSTTLLLKVAAGADHAAERRFFECYSRLARAVIVASGIRKSHDIEDITQETMAAAMQALRISRYQRDQGAFRPWFKGILRHKIADARQSAARSVMPAETLPDQADPALPPDKAFEAAFDAEWRAIAMEEAIRAIKNEVKPTTWQAYDLVERQGWTRKDAAEHLGISRSAVYLSNLRIRRRLKRLLGTQD